MSSTYYVEKITDEEGKHTSPMVSWGIFSSQKEAQNKINNYCMYSGEPRWLYVVKLANSSG